MRKAILLLIGCTLAWAQQSNIGSRNPNYLNANIRQGTTVPTSCTYNQLFVKTDATAGQNVYVCVSGSFVQQKAGTSTATEMSGPNFCLDAGSSDTYACNLSPAISAYVTGTHYWFMANTINTGAASINFNGKGALTIKKMPGAITTDLADGDIRAGQWVEVIYDGTNAQMSSQLGNAPSGGTTVSAGALASLPACSTTAFLYVFTDSAYTDAYCDGAKTVTYRYQGQAVTLPVTTGWGWVNQGGATIDTSTYGFWSLTAPLNATPSARYWAKTLPAAPYTITVLVQIQGSFTNYQRAGIALRDSEGGKLAVYDFIGISSYMNLREEIWTDTTTPTGTTPLTVAPFERGSAIWLKLVDTGAAGGNLRQISYSVNGVTWTQLLSESNTANVTPNQFGIFASEETNVTTVTINLLSITGI